jgi:tRNA A58 N-methylase Trm61
MAPSDQYFLGYSPAEQQRLERQARSLAPDANLLFDWIGVRPGSRAVEIGCGPLGCLEILSRRVGPTGSVVGVEINADAVRLARKIRQTTRSGMSRFIKETPKPLAFHVNRLIWLRLGWCL